MDWVSMEQEVPEPSCCVVSSACNSFFLDSFSLRSGLCSVVTDSVSSTVLMSLLVGLEASGHNWRPFDGDWLDWLDSSKAPPFSEDLDRGLRCCELDRERVLDLRLWCLEQDREFLLDEQECE